MATAEATTKPGQIYLITGPRGYTGQRMEEITIQGVLAGPVEALIAGNRFNFYNIAYGLASFTGHFRYILENHITLSRAETCYQVVELLSETEENESLTLVSDLLVTFEDESAPEAEIDDLVFEGITQLRRLASHAPVIVSAHPGEGRPRLFDSLRKAAHVVERPESQTKYAPVSKENLEVLMGHTKLPFTMQYKQERSRFTQMKRGLLLKDDKRRFGDMFDKAEFHISACEKAAHPLPMTSIGLAIDLEQEKAIYRLERLTEDKDEEIRNLRQKLTEKDQRILALEGRVADIDEKVNRRLDDFREEMLALKYPDYAEAA